MRENCLRESSVNLSTHSLHFVVPGKLTTRTGGYHYDRRIISALRSLGWVVHLHELDDSFPEPSAQALRGAEDLFTSLPDDDRIVVDGLAFACLPALMSAHASRLKLHALVHHPLARETGLGPARKRDLFDSEQQALTAATGIIVTSEFTADELAAYLTTPIPVTVVRPGVDALAQAAGSGSGLKNLLCVATVTPRKNHLGLIDALIPLSEHPWQLTCVGSLDRHPEYADVVMQRINQADLKDRIRLCGEVTDDSLSAFYQQADLFVSASAYEGYGMVYDEAVGYGLPVISTRVGAVEAIVPAGARRLVEPHNTGALCRAVQSVMADSNAFRVMQGAARTGRRSRRSWQTAGDEFARAVL